MAYFIFERSKGFELWRRYWAGSRVGSLSRIGHPSRVCRWHRFLGRSARTQSPAGSPVGFPSGPRRVPSLRRDPASLSRKEKFDRLGKGHVNLVKAWWSGSGMGRSLPRGKAAGRSPGGHFCAPPALLHSVYSPSCLHITRRRTGQRGMWLAPQRPPSRKSCKPNDSNRRAARHPETGNASLDLRWAPRRQHGDHLGPTNLGRYANYCARQGRKFNTSSTFAQGCKRQHTPRVRIARV
jgi:hypothetical protein